MVASIHPLCLPKLILLGSLSSVESIESGVIVGLLVEQYGHVTTKLISPVAVQDFGSVSLFDEPVTWEDAEWQ
jgi:hypothetical protein